MSDRTTTIRIVIQILIVFTALASLAIAVRLLFHDEPNTVDPAWMVLPFAVAAPVLFGVFHPRRPAEDPRPPKG